MTKRCKLVVLTNCVEGEDEEFNRWYSDMHLDDVLKVQDFVAAQRFRLAGVVSADKPYRYCAIYEVETDDPAAALARLQAKAGTPEMFVSDTLAPPAYAVLYEEIAPPRLQGG